MTSTKKSVTSKVRNTKAQSKIGKNESAESMMKRAFQPLFSPKDGKARLTFCGLEHSYNNEKKIIDGVQQIVEVPKLILVFSCLDETHESPQNIGLRLNYTLSKNNALGRFLLLLGYEFRDKLEVIDEEDDEYGQRVKYGNPREVCDFLRNKAGLVFKAELQKATGINRKGEIYEKALWNIKDKTLEPLMKNGQQVRDMLASDVDDEDFQNPKIDMTNDD